jgi:hypothetical protein
MSDQNQALEHFVINYPNGSLIDQEKFEKLSDDMVRKWLTSEEANKVAHAGKDCYIRCQVFNIILARMDLDLLKETCDRLNVLATDTCCARVATSCIFADGIGFLKILDYLNKRYWNGSHASLIIENMFWKGASAQQIISVAEVVGTPSWQTCDSIVSTICNGMNRSIHKDYVPLFAWCWDAAFRGMVGWYTEYDISRYKQRYMSIVASTGKKDLLSWVQNKDY